MIKYFSTENEIQKLYSQFGLVVPVGDQGLTKAPSIGILPSSSTQNSVTAQFNVMSGGDITALEYKVNDGEATSLTPTKGAVTITIEELEYNSGPYDVTLSATNEIGTTDATTTIALQPYTNWATPDEVLAGNRYIGEDSEEHVGQIVTKTSSDVAVHDGSITVPAGYYASQVSKTYPNPSGVINITSNGTDIDVTDYVYANVNVQPTLETAPVTPTTSAQTITPSTGYDGIGQVNVSAVTSSIDANITAGNIKDGVTILGVTGTMTGGPTDGGAVISSVELVNDGGYECTVTFDTMPALDTANHKYVADLIAYCVEQSGVFADQTYHYNNMTSIPQASCVIDSTLNTITFFDVNAPLDGDGNILSSTPGYILIYEDGYDNLKYKISCTVTVPDANL